ncbi:NADPH-dependent FMN reductase [Sciscionella marina]|uniref:NADPH-dependent FMN reductase n=1 Tax=Sciscionella marina TaxID=508770 RepID=UPI00037278EC|nr:NAD(P)H-dependent oxidoreductase [Sciscionella marina]
MTVSIVGIGGSTRPDSQSGRALRLVLAGAEQAGAKVSAITGADLELPFYDPSIAERPAAAASMIELLRAADGVVFVSPGYHGTVSGLVKNALDYIEELRTDERPYLDGRAIGCVAVAAGWQASVNTLNALRSIAHATRGWPTPLGAAVNSIEVGFDASGGCTDDRVAANLAMIGAQVTEFATRRTA